MVGNDSCDRGRKALAATALGVVCCCSATDLCPDSYFSQADQMIRLYMDHFRACRSNISNRRHQSTAKRPRISVEVQKDRSEEHTSELQSLMRISYAVFCLKTKNKTIYRMK